MTPAQYLKRSGRMNDLNIVWSEIADERDRQELVHPFDSLYKLATIPPTPARPTPLSVLFEEVGEVAKAINERHDSSALREELVQVAACALAWIEAIDALIEEARDDG